MNILHKIKKIKANWMGHILRRNCLLKHVIEGNIERRTEVTGRRGRRHKQLLDDSHEARGYWKLKQEAPARTLFRTHFGRANGHVVRQTTEWMNEFIFHVLRRWVIWEYVFEIPEARTLSEKVVACLKTLYGHSIKSTRRNPNGTASKPSDVRTSTTSTQYW